MPGTPDPLQKARDRARRAELADQIDIADIDAELQGSGRHQRFQRAMLQPLFGVEPLLLGKAAVMRGHLIGPEPLRQLPRRPLGQPAGVDKDQGGAVRLDQLGQAVIDLLPDLARHHRFERRGRDFESQIARPAVAGIDHRALRTGRAIRVVWPAMLLLSPLRPGGEGQTEGGRDWGSGAHLTLPSLRAGPLPLPPEGRRGASAAGPDQKSGDRLDRLLRRRQADAQQGLLAQPRQPFERHRQMRTALVRRHRVDLVDDHGSRRRQHFAAGFGAEQDVKRFRAW